MKQLRTTFPACVADEKGYLYYVTCEEHAIKRMCLKDRKVEYIDNPDDYDPFIWTGVDSMAYESGKLYLLEQGGRWVMEYSVLEKRSRIFDINCGFYSCLNIASVSVFEGKLFLCPSFKDVMVIIDLETGNVEERPDLCGGEKYVFHREDIVYVYGGKKIPSPYGLFSCGCRVETDMWIFLEREPIVIRYGLLTGAVKRYQLPEEMKGSIHAVWKEDIFYILTVEGNIYLWETGMEKAELLWSAEGEAPYPYFRKMAVTDKNIWLLPFLGEDIYIIDLKQKEKKKYDGYPKDFHYYTDLDPEKSRYFDYCEDSENYYFAMHCTNYILVIEKVTGQGKWISPIEPDLYDKIKYYKNSGLRNYIEEDFGLDGLFSIIEQGESIGDETEKMKSGRNMWNILK